jgi:hypothetical protein
MGTAAGWAGAKVRGFDWSQFDAALEFLAVPRPRWSVYGNLANSLRAADPSQMPVSSTVRAFSTNAR